MYKKSFDRFSRQVGGPALRAGVGLPHVPALLSLSVVVRQEGIERHRPPRRALSQPPPPLSPHHHPQQVSLPSSSAVEATVAKLVVLDQPVALQLAGKEAQVVDQREIVHHPVVPGPDPPHPVSATGVG